MFAEKLMVIVALGLGVAFPCVLSWEAAYATHSEQSPTILAKNDKSSQESSSDFAMLKGRWRRPDGGYVIDIKAIDSTGKVDASYYNPNPIRVSKAEVTKEGDTTKVFIELRDTGYPGCAYTLTYDPQTDQLRGVYFQAAIQQNFDVVFFRIK
jgi:hypothetical protein